MGLTMGCAALSGGHTSLTRTSGGRRRWKCSRNTAGWKQ